MVEPIAEPKHVRGEIDADPDPDDVEFQLGEAAFDLAQATNVEALDPDVRQRLEQKLAALKLLEGPDRETSQHSVGDASKTYRGNTIERLKREIDSLDPSGNLIEDRKPQANFEVF